MASPEQQRPSAENNVETPTAATERLEALEKKQEQSVEKNQTNVEQAKTEAKRNALEHAVSVEKSSAEREHKQPATAAPRRYGKISKQDKAKAFDKHMKQVQADMSTSSRFFSKFIHTPVVEKTSDALGSTVARPDAILSGAVAAFILVLAVYIVAKTFGYVLSGFETIGAFIIGWILGIVYDYLKALVTGKSA